jgi:hypothetical protein
MTSKNFRREELSLIFSQMLRITFQYTIFVDSPSGLRPFSQSGPRREEVNELLSYVADDPNGF